MKPPLRILAVLGSRVLYGMERANIEVYEALRDTGAAVLVAVEDHDSFQAIPNELLRRHMDFVRIPFGGRRVEGYFFDFLFRNPFLFLGANWKIYRLIRSFSPTHVFVPNPIYFLNCIVPLALSRTPVIYRIGDAPSLHNFFWRLLWRRIVARTDYFVADSEFIAKKLEGMGVSRAQIAVIYSEAPVREHEPEPNRIPGNLQHFLFIGQIGAHKGVDRLIEAFGRIALEYPKAHLTIIGRISEWRGDDWARSLRGRTLANPVLGDRITFTGETEDIYSHLAESAFLVVPSAWDEPQGIVAIEAKAAARPSVIFPSGGLQELVTHGIDGFICRDKSIEALEEGLRYYLDRPDLALAHGSNALASIERLGIDRFTEHWFRVCEAAIEKNSSLSEPISTMQ